MENNKKILIPTIVAVATLVLLVFGATYAYFTIESTNNFGTKELNATLEDMADAVVLEQLENTLSLDVTRAMMSEDNAGTTYYASGSSTPANIAKMSVAGEGRYACDYTISVTKSASSEENDLYTAFQGMSTKSTGQINFNVDERRYDFYSSYLFPITYSRRIYGITKNTPQYITANLSLLNKNVNQNVLKGKDITLTFEVTNFDCYLTEADESAPIYAIYGMDDYSYMMTLAFYQNHDEVNVGDTYNGLTVTEVYKNLNNTNYTSVEDVPWKDALDAYASVEIRDVIAPKDIHYWFNNNNVYSINGDGKLDTSNITDMSYLFANNESVGFDLSLWDTSNVTNMSHMFENACNSTGITFDLSSWDTSNVTDMSYMFADAASIMSFNVNISTWDTSNVTNMTQMFKNAGMYEFSVGDITRREVTANGKTYIAWDTSKVVNMDGMFNGAGSDCDYSLDLRSWHVPLVTNPIDFGDSSKITPPTWGN